MAIRFTSDQNGWQIMLAEIGHLASQMETGAGNVSSDCVRRVTMVGQLVSAVVRSDPSIWSQLAQVGINQ